MASNFRSEIFKLCKSLQKNEDVKKLQTLVHDLSVSIENKKTGVFHNCLHGDFAYLAKHYNSQFHGYLFVDDHAGKLDLPIKLIIEHLTPDERMLIEAGHITIISLLNMCLSEFCNYSQIIGEAINPYYLYRKVEYSKDIQPFLSESELKRAAEAFKEGSVYKALLDSKFWYVFKDVPRDQMSVLANISEQEMKTNVSDEVVPHLRDFVFNTVGKYKNVADVMYAYTILMYALKDSLRIACQMLYEAMCGDDLIVLNNDNVINIEDQSSNVVCHRFKVLMLGTDVSISGSRMGSMILLDCDTRENNHIHEFGMIIAATMSWSQESGHTTKYTFNSVNDQLIGIYNLTDHILEARLPKVDV